MHRGYIKTWRKTLDGGWLRNHKLWAFWSWCLLKASHKPYKQIVGSQEIDLEPGQFIFGRKAAGTFLGMSEGSIRRCESALKVMGNIAVQTTNKFSIITVLNWDIYQGEEGEAAIKSANKRQTNGKQTATNKNEKNEKNIVNPLSDFDQFWKEYPRRDGKKKALQAWEKAKARGELPDLSVIVSSLVKHKFSKQWTKDEGEFIPLPATWINQARWQDELDGGGQDLLAWAKAADEADAEKDVPDSIMEGMNE